MGVKEVSAGYSSQQSARVPNGYKQTEVGVIPEDWEAVPLESVTPLNVKNGIVDGPFGSNLKTIHYRSSGIPIITSGYVTNGRFYAESYLYVDKGKFLEEKRSAVSPGDIVMAKIGERCGASAILPSDHERGILSGNALKISVDSSRYSTFYVWQYLWMLHTSGGMELLRTVGAQPALSMANLKKHKIPVPLSKLEQNAIAEALSDADALIESLEQLLTKKRQLKQGAMQELLTGKKRLPGFSGEWPVSTLGELVDSIVGGGTPSRNVPEYWGGTIPWMTVKDFAKFSPHRTIEYITFEGLKSSASHLIQSGALITSTRMALGKAVIFEVDVSINQDLKALFPRSDVDVTFLYFWFQFNEHRISELGSGSTVMGISLVDLKKIELKNPCRDEQTAIATILSGMDAELARLQEKLTKACAIKRGMMQELLTGRIRLIHP